MLIILFSKHRMQMLWNLKQPLKRTLIGLGRELKQKDFFVSTSWFYSFLKCNKSIFKHLLSHLILQYAFAGHHKTLSFCNLGQQTSSHPWEKFLPLHGHDFKSFVIQSSGLRSKGLDQNWTLNSHKDTHPPTTNFFYHFQDSYEVVKFNPKLNTIP